MDSSTHPAPAADDATPARDEDPEPAPARGRAAAPIENHHFQRPVVSPVTPPSGPARPARATR